MPSTGAGTAGQHVGDRGNGVGVEALESRRREGTRTAPPPRPHSCGKSEVRGPRLLGKG